MTTKSFLKVMAWLFLLAGVGGLAAAGWLCWNSAAPADYGVPAIGGTFWLLCSAIAFYLRLRLA